VTKVTNVTARPLSLEAEMLLGHTVLKSAMTLSGWVVVDTAVEVCVVGDDEDETSEYEQPVMARHVTGVRSTCTAGLDNCNTHITRLMTTQQTSPCALFSKFHIDSFNSFPHDDASLQTKLADKRIPRRAGRRRIAADKARRQTNTSSLSDDASLQTKLADKRIPRR